MKKIITLFIFVAFAYSASAQYKTLNDYSALSIIKQDTVHFSQYYGKKVMIVNTASFCGYTPEFANLQQLYTQYKQYNFEIIGFPCNDFGHQDPYDDSTIYNFAVSNYGVTFKLMSKISITAADTAPIYKWLQRKNLNGKLNAKVTWNFNKFLIDEAGNWVGYYDSPVNPLTTGITNWIKSPSVLDVAPLDDTEELIRAAENFSGSSIDLTVNSSAPRHYTIAIYSVEGRLLSTIYDGMADNTQIINYDHSALSPGIYFIKVQSNGAQQTIKCAFVR